MEQEELNTIDCHEPPTRRRAYLEATVLCALAAGINFLLSDYTDAGELPHYLLWIPVLLVTAQYGTLPGLYSAALTTIFLYAGRLPPPAVDDDFYSYWWKIGVVPLPWFVSATVVGELVMKHRRARTKLKEDLEFALERERLFISAYAELEQLKEQREKELASISCSPAQIFRIISQSDLKTQESVLNCVFELVDALMQPRKFSLYLVRDNRLRLTRSHGWQDGDSFLQEFDSDTPLYKAIVLGRQPVSITETADRTVIDSQGLLAVPFIDMKTSKVFGMIKVEHAEWERITVVHRSTLALAAQWGGGMFGYAQEFKVAYLTPRLVTRNDDDIVDAVQGGS